MTKRAWNKFLIWIGFKKPEQPIDMSFVIMGYRDLKETMRSGNNKILLSDAKNKLIPNKYPDIGYKGQILPNHWQPNSKLKYSYINKETKVVRYFDEFQISDEWMPLFDYNPFNLKFDYSITELEKMKEDRDNGDIIDRLNYAKDCYQPKELFDEAIQEIKKLRELIKGNQND